MRFTGIQRLLVGGALDLVLTGFVALLSVLVGLNFGEPVGVAVDLAACTAAALTVRWPRLAGTALGVVLLIYLTAPEPWAETGEYAALIPVLGAGIRNQPRQRMWLTACYLSILTVRQLIGYPDDLTGLISALVWAMLFALVWLLGGAIAAFQRAEEQTRIAALAQQRLGLARDLHDTVARSLVRAARHAHRAAAEQDATQLGAIADEVGKAAGQLRWVLGALRDSDSGTTLNSEGSFAVAVRDSMEQLRVRGFQVTTSIEGSLDDVPAQAGSVLAEIVKEAAANVERHGAAGRPCTLVVSIDDAAADLALINEVDETGSRSSSTRPLGLLGAAERLALVGGQLEARQEGTHWITRATVPIAGRP
ncbi:MAG: histidine kinase [Micropruina sp.]|uniref:sensor histidine kinase n=1 Tax=Micropruina sp. TaxID=2737536 RepID=UPI0039E5D231